MKTQRLIVYALLTLFFSWLSACQHTTDENSSATENGELFISLTDAPGDFTNYTVDISSLTLTKANGTVVQTLPENTRIDFSQYVDMTEFLTAAQIPKGIYTKATLTLDYNNADIQVENNNGDNVKVASIVDENGNPVTQLEVAVHLEDRNRLLIAPGIPAHLSLDFDLKVSNSVSFDLPESPALTVQPMLVADINVDLDKPQRVRGLLQDVNTNNNSFKILVRPFFQPLRNNDKFGKIKIFTNSTTHFEIDGAQYTGDSGILALDNLTTLSAISVTGKFKASTHVFVATEVYAGSSVPGGELDAVVGTVTARADNVITVKGATLVRTNGTVIFNDLIAITIADSTQVFKQGSMDAANIGDISVGQRIRVFGTIANNGSTQLEMDASNGRVRLLYTELKGKAIEVDATAASQLTMELSKINNRNVEIFDFTGTGIDMANDASPSSYEINTGALKLDTLEPNEYLKVLGFTSAFGSAPSDFNAVSIVDIGAVKSKLAIHWKPESTDALVFSSQGINLNLEGSSRLHHIARNGQRFDLSALPTQLMLTAKNEIGIYRIEQAHASTIHTSFDSYAMDIAARIEAGQKVKAIMGRGYYDEATNKFSAEQLNVILR